MVEADYIEDKSPHLLAPEKPIPESVPVKVTKVESTQTDAQEFVLWKTIAAGSMGGVAITVVGHPMETVKTRLQTGATTNILRGCYKGMLSPLLGTTPFFASSYFGFRLGRSLTGERTDTPSIMASGGIAGVISTFVRTPTDRVKIVAQNERISSQQAIKNLFAARGFFGVYQGFGATAFWMIPSSMMFWGGVEFWSWAFKDTDDYVRPFLGGGMAGVTEWICCLPFDTVKTRVQAGTDPSVMAAIRSTYSGGLRSMYRGFVPMMVRAFPANGAAIWATSMGNKLLKDI